MATEYGTPDDENPEWTRADFSRARRMDQLSGSTLHEKLAALQAEHDRYRAQHPEKTVIRLELSRDVVEGIQENGPDWQDKVDSVLRDWLASSKQAS